MIGKDDSLQSAIRRTKIALGQAEFLPLAPDELATVVKTLVADALVSENGDIARLRRNVRAGKLTRARLRRDAEVLLRQWLTELRRHGDPTWQPLLDTPALSPRIVELALDTALSEALAPELRLSPFPLSLPPWPVYALVFSAFPHVTNELYPLLVDAYVADLELHGRRTFHVIGVHESWLDGGSCRHAILFDEATPGIVEGELITPAAVDGAQALALDLREEEATHARIAEMLAGIPLLNPLEGARRLDDKAWTGRCWQQASLETPAFMTVSVDLPAEEIRGRLRLAVRRFGTQLVVKPAGSTEGRGVERVACVSAEDEEGLVHRLLDMQRTSEVIVAKERGMLRYQREGRPVRCTVRVNVCWDGARAWGESGYTQVAADPETIASAGRGGSLVALPELWAHLCLENGTPYSPTPEDWQTLLQAAERGVGALAQALGEQMPALVGVDLLLDLTQAGTLLPVLLEANPRPSGMGHSRFVTPDGPSEEPGVSLHLWAVVARLLHSAR